MQRLRRPAADAVAAGGSAAAPPIDLRAPLGDALELVRPALEEKSIMLASATLGAGPVRRAGQPRRAGGAVPQSRAERPRGHAALAGMVTVEVTRTDDPCHRRGVDSGSRRSRPSCWSGSSNPSSPPRQRGSGLGLAISAGIAQAHGARLRAAQPAGRAARSSLSSFPAGIGDTSGGRREHCPRR